MGERERDERHILTTPSSLATQRCRRVDTAVWKGRMRRVRWTLLVEGAARGIGRDRDPHRRCTRGAVVFAVSCVCDHCGAARRAAHSSNSSSSGCRSPAAHARKSTQPHTHTHTQTQQRRTEKKKRQQSREREREGSMTDRALFSWHAMKRKGAGKVSDICGGPSPSLVPRWPDTLQ